MVRDGMQQRELVSFLRSNPVAALASINAKGMPEIMAIYFYVEHDLSISFITKVKTRKFENISTTPSISLLVYEKDRLMSAEIHGEAKVIDDTIEFVQTIERFQEVFERQRKWLPPISQIEAGNYTAYKIFPKRIYFRRFSEEGGEPSSKEFVF